MDKSPVLQPGCEHGIKMGRIGDRPYGVFICSILLRAAHLLGAAVFTASFLLDSPQQPPTTYLVIALLSGALLFAADGWRHRQLYREVSGVITLLKALLLGAAYHGYLPLPATAVLVFLLATLGAHAPKNIRHRLLP